MKTQETQIYKFKHKQQQTMKTAFTYIVLMAVVFPATAVFAQEAGNPKLKPSVEIGGFVLNTHELPEDLVCDTDIGLVYHKGPSVCISFYPRSKIKGRQGGGADRVVKAPNGHYISMGQNLLFSPKAKGVTWSEGEEPWKWKGSDRHCLVPFIDPSEPNRIYVIGTMNDAFGFRYSNDNGNTWSDYNSI